MSRRFSIGVGVLFLLAMIGLVVMHRWRPVDSAPEDSGSTNSVSPELVRQFVALEARENEVNRTIWAEEMAAEKFGELFDNLWDSLNASSNKFTVLEQFPAGKILTSRYGAPQSLSHGIDLFVPQGTGPVWSQGQWRQCLSDWARAGWEVGHVEFRHYQFDPPRSGDAARSRYRFVADLTNPTDSRRAILEGDLKVQWTASVSPAGAPGVAWIDASDLVLKSRRGPPPFRPILETDIDPFPNTYFIDPLIVHDLDGDGKSEVILAARNLLYRQQSDGTYQPEPLLKFPPPVLFTGVVADFDGDGVADFLCADFEGLLLFKGSPQGGFDQPGRRVWEANPHLKYGQVLSCGDIDHDGDLDVFLGQYKVPYTRGQMPAPYFDANDGYPAYLLLNDGRGNFSDATAAAGLQTKRWRRTYSASFADLDGDENLDLVVVSDFAGLDLYRNDGRGHFIDVTTNWAPGARGFGMAHALADFNGDGRLGLLMVGMGSPTAERLEHLGLTRTGPMGDREMRREMMFGNRLLLHGDHGFELGPLGQSMARSGWSWGCSAFDFDNDGFPDVYLATGLETKQSVRDYDAEFWRHDIFVGTSKDDVVANAYFSAKANRTRGAGWSYGGHESNRFFLNQGGASFVEAAHLLGVGLDRDSRCVVSDDLDGDGRVDLLVTTFEAWPQLKQTLRIYKNEVTESGHWIGFRFREGGGGLSPVGTKITIHYPGGQSVHQIVTGDSYRAQHAPTAHFGLGQAERVDTVDIRWIGGQSLRLEAPSIDRYYDIAAPRQRPGVKP